MFHVKQFIHYLYKLPIHRLVFFVFLFTIPLQTRTLFHVQQAYIDWYFNYHLAFFFYISDILLITTLLSWIILEKPKINLQEPLYRYALLFLIAAAVTLFHVQRIDLAVYQLLKWLELLLLLVYIRENFVKHYEFWLILAIFSVSAIFQAFLGILQFHVKHSLGLSFLGEYVSPIGTAGLSTIAVEGEKVLRAYGTFPHPNVLGAFLVLGLGFLLSFMVSRETLKWKLIVSCATYIVILGLFFTFSRIGWIGALLLFPTYLGFTWNYEGTLRNRTNGALLVLILIVSCGTLLFGYKNLLVSRATEVSGSTAIEDRGLFNRNALELMRSRPLLGVGVGNYIVSLQEHKQLLPWQYQPAHNIYLHILAEQGIVGLVLFLSIIFAIFKEAWPHKRNVLGFSLLTITGVFLLMGLFDHYFVTIQQGRLMFFTILGLLAALPNLKQEVLP